jgi:hypothetical protein
MKLVAAIEEALARKSVTIDRFFFDWRGGAPEASDAAFDDVRVLIGRYAPIAGARDHSYWSDPGPCSMHIDDVEAIWSAIDADDDWTPLHARIDAVRRMGEAYRANA